MARTPGNDAASSPMARSGQRRSAQQRAPQREGAAVVLTPEGQRRLAARAAWLTLDSLFHKGLTLGRSDVRNATGTEAGHTGR
jgi:hypothetical protein